MNKRKNNLKEMERRVQLNTSSSADTDRNRELKTVKTPKSEPKEPKEPKELKDMEIKEDKEVKEMEIELSER